jgi:hypothetical protein
MLAYELSDDEKRLIAAFDQGAAVARKGGFLSDNPHEWGSDMWHAWREGFWDSRRVIHN